MVGGVSFFVIAINLTLFSGLKLPTFDLNNFLIWLIGAYFLGHFIQGLANIINKIPLLKLLVSEKKKDFSPKELIILKDAAKFFDIKDQENSFVWNICYMLSTAKDITGQIQSFNAYYSMYRGWLVIFLAESVYLGYVLIHFKNMVALLPLFLSVFLVIVFYMRSARFWQYLRDKVLQTFVVIKKLRI